MPWRLIHLESEEVVETVYSGAVTAEELLAAIRANVAAGQARGVKRFLSDCRPMDAGGSLTDVYELPAVYESLGAGRDWKEAILLPVRPAAEDELRFYETVSLNKGFRVRIFDSRVAALAWLAEEGDAAPAGE